MLLHRALTKITEFLKVKTAAVRFMKAKIIRQTDTRQSVTQCLC